MWIGNLYAIAVGFLLFFFSRIPLSLFSPEEEVVRFGTMMAKVLGPSYFLLNTCNILIGMSRGSGDSFSTMFLSVLNLCGVRVLWLVIMIPLFPSIYTLYLGYPITWALTAAAIAIHYCMVTWPHVKQSLMSN